MEYLTVDEVAARLRLARKTLWNWHNLRKGPPVTKVGSKLLYRADKLEAWEKSKTTGVPIGR